jgi:nicotinamidase-related amidase
VTCAVATIDLQYEFLDPAGSAAGHFEKSTCVPSVMRLLAAARSHGHRVIHVRTVHDGPGSLPRPLRSTFPDGLCLRGTRGSELITGLVQEGDLVLEKQQFSAFEGTQLAEHLRSVRRILLVGLAIDCCVLATAFGAVASTTADIVIPYQAVSASTSGAYLSALDIVGKSIGSVVDLEELVDSGAGFLAQTYGAFERSHAEAWINPRVQQAAAIGNRAVRSGEVQLRVDALLAEYAQFESTVSDTHPSATEA